jgi:hypothetical protein
VTDKTDPDWEPIMKKAAAIVTNRGGRTCHAAIVSRELGVPAIVGCGNATEAIKDGQEVTVSCAEGDEGFVYAGLLPFEVTRTDLRDLPHERDRASGSHARCGRTHLLDAAPGRVGQAQHGPRAIAYADVVNAEQKSLTVKRL